jgi:hypothetical protein
LFTSRKHTAKHVKLEMLLLSRYDKDGEIRLVRATSKHTLQKEQMQKKSLSHS